jgi:hypothetical protein
MIEDDYGKEIDVPASSSLKASIVQANGPATATSTPGGNDQIALVFLYTVDNSKTDRMCLGDQDEFVFVPVEKPRWQPGSTGRSVLP